MVTITFTSAVGSRHYTSPRSFRHNKTLKVTLA